MDNFVSKWNVTMPNFQIKLEDLQKPTPIFFIEAVLVLFESFDIQTDRILRAKHANTIENCDINEEHSPLAHLAAATNFFLMKMNLVDQILINFNITMFDLLMPKSSTVCQCLNVLYNFLLFINLRQQELLEEEKEIEKLTQNMKNIAQEEELLKNEIDQKYLEKSLIKKHIQQREDEIMLLKNGLEDPEIEVNELKTNYDTIQAQLESIQAELVNKQTANNILEEEMLKLKGNILTENEQIAIMNMKESGIQRDTEVKMKLEEVHKKLSKKDTDIKTLKAVGLSLSECHSFLDSLEELYSKIKDTQNVNSASYGEEKSLRDLQKYDATLVHKCTEYERIEKELDEELERIKLEIKYESENNLKEKNIITKELERNDIAIHNSEKVIKKIQAKTFEYDTEYKSLMKMYTEVIPALYDQSINDNIQDVNTILEDLEYVYRRKK